MAAQGGGPGRPSRAQSNLGLMYANGSGVYRTRRPRSSGIARPRSTPAHCPVHARLMYASGTGVPADTAAAASGSRKGSQAPTTIGSVYNLALAHAGGLAWHATRRRPHSWFRRAANRGDAQRSCRAGHAYANGVVSRATRRRQWAWYRRAAGTGLASAQTNLGARYVSGRGVAADPAEAARWFSGQHASATRAAVDLGVLYANGTGAAHGAAAALVLLAMAARRASAPRSGAATPSPVIRSAQPDTGAARGRSAVGRRR